jgi:hypothetical protein
MPFHAIFTIADNDLGKVATAPADYYWDRLKHFYNSNLDKPISAITTTLDKPISAITTTMNGLEHDRAALVQLIEHMGSDVLYYQFQAPIIQNRIQIQNLFTILSAAHRDDQDTEAPLAALANAINNTKQNEFTNDGQIPTLEQFCSQASAIKRIKAIYRHHQGFGSGLFGGLNPVYRARSAGAVIQALKSNSRNATESGRDNSASSTTLEQLGLERFAVGN